MKLFLKTIISFILILILIILIILLPRCSLKPWSMVRFSSILPEDYNNMDIDALIKKYPYYYKQNTFIYILSHATNEYMYKGEDPYCLTIVFSSNDDEKTISIKSLQIINDDINYLDNSINYQNHLFKEKTENSELSESISATFSTPYIFNLQKYMNNIEVKLIAVIDNEEIESSFILSRNETKGLFQWND